MAKFSYCAYNAVYGFIKPAEKTGCILVKAGLNLCRAKGLNIIG